MSFDLEAALLSDNPDEVADDVVAGDAEDQGSIHDTLAKRPNLDAEQTDDSSSEDGLVAAAPDADETPEPAAPVTPETPPPTAPTPEPDPFAEAFFERAARSGLDLKGKYKTADDAIAGLTNAARLVGQRNELAELGRQLQEDPKAFYARMKTFFEPEQAKPAPTAAVTPAVDPSVPEWNDAWRDLFDDSGKPIVGADPSIIKKVAKYQSWLQEEQLALVRDPLGKLLPKLQPQIEQLAQKKAEELFAQRQQEESQRQALADQHYEAESLIRTVAPWAYEGGDVTKRVPTEAGKIFHQFVTIAETPDATGSVMIPNMKTRCEWAVLKTREYLSATQQKNEAPARAPAAVAKLTAKPNSKSGDKNPVTAWPKGRTLEDELKKLLV